MSAVDAFSALATLFGLGAVLAFTIGGIFHTNANSLDDYRIVSRMYLVTLIFISVIGLSAFLLFGVTH